MSAARLVRIGGASGFWGDSGVAAPQLKRKQVFRVVWAGGSVEVGQVERAVEREAHAGAVGLAPAAVHAGEGREVPA